MITGKIGKRAILQPDITLDNVRVPAENRLPGCHSFKDVTRVLTSTRSGASWESLGHAIAAYEAAVEYSKTRHQFGRPIASFQLVQNKLANMLAELTAMQLICFRLAVLAEDGRMTGPMASLAKMHTAQKARWICSEARDMLGGNGVLLENHVARHMTDMEVVSTYEGTDSIQSLLVGREITGISAFSYPVTLNPNTSKQGNTMSNFTNRVAVVTGGAQGIGAATALKLAAGGATVVVLDLNEDGAKDTAQQISADRRCSRRAAGPSRPSATSRTKPPWTGSSKKSTASSAGWTSWSTMPASPATICSSR